MEAHDHDREESALPLAAEVRVFEQHRDEWVRDGHENQWVVIRDPKVVGFFDSLRDGYLAGLREFGTGVPFMVKQVRREDDIAIIQRTARPRP